ncbi:saccharopine dehydrogenase C-terminal domain-containing protein [Acanthopleuribacter pedis]|uniref:Saccharopine dehydrogenase NADP-binding domain-containing protein n=1 Tax=Acanthopleuribacter pedis TaxID=442870 RepID=A0A8J7QFU0_9BACT|nr:saccharopine dehydrogenase C-terminal domain-containing protein [Acanthopleuribacter pedis]MBO1319175.1 saccharopine dehydrogenase NADP-binding domain-containing protein [Acanthopleuribacter pedis]
MKSVLVLGAGMVSRPLVDYLLDAGYAVTLCDRFEAQAQAVTAGRPNTTALQLESSETDRITELVGRHDLVVSLLPPALHIGVARIALAAGKHFLTASYLSDAMKALEDEVKAKDLVFLNEIGLDPGLDHMTTMEIIDLAAAEGYDIVSYESHCGGLPSKKAANNPLRYKFSWSPAGVLGALQRPSKFRRDGDVQEVPGSDMLAHAEVLHIPGVGVYESTPNADSLFYGDSYGLDKAQTLRRGTLRYPGWASFWRFMLAHNLTNRDNALRFDGEPAGKALTVLAGLPAGTELTALVHEHAPQHASVFIEILASLGLLDPDVQLTGEYTAFDILLERALATCQFDADEADLVVLHHEFIVEKDGKRERWTSSLVQEGIPAEQKTAMALTVGIPTAISAHLVLQEQFPQRGVLIPIAREIYQPILAEMGRLGFHHQVKRYPL